MRSRLLVLMFLILGLHTQAQYYLLNFKGVGAATTIDSIRVLNLAQNTTVKINGTDTLLLAGVVGQPKPQLFNQRIDAWPLPSNGECKIKFFSPLKENAHITIFDASGRKILTEVIPLASGENFFDISALPAGINILHIQLSNYNLSTKIPVVQKGNSVPSIHNFSHQPVLKKSKAVIVMQYNDNEVLLFKAYSGNYARFQPWIINASQTIYFDFIACTDAIGNNYPVVRIGNQVWMAQNLKTTQFNNGTPIPIVTDNNTWLNTTTPAMSWYNNNAAEYGYWGAFYNFYAVEGDNICPPGWHVPSLGDFEQLLVVLQNFGYNYNGMIDPDNDPYSNDFTAKSLSSRYFWSSTDVAGAPGNTDYPNYRNRTAFEAFPYGVRNGYTGAFNNHTITTFFWSKTVTPNQEAYRMQLFYSNPSSGLSTNPKVTGMNVRCIKN